MSTTTTISLKKLQQRNRRRAHRAAAVAAPAPPVLRRGHRQRNNARSVQFSATCTAKPFLKGVPPEKTVSAFTELVIPIILPPLVEEAEALPQEEEEDVFFGDEAGHEPAEPVEQSKRRVGLRREVASLSSHLGNYWAVDTLPPRECEGNLCVSSREVRVSYLCFMYSLCS